MQNKITFDTLGYAKTLKTAGIEQSEIYSEALANALNHNFYTQYEVDKMIDAALMKFHERTLEMKREWEESERKRDEVWNETQHKRDLEMQKLELRFEKKCDQIRTQFEKKCDQVRTQCITILGSLIVITQTIATFAHSFFH